jgi:putative tricarboxylic transport membrane protein
MHLSDRTTGLFLIGVGAAAIYGASRLPPMPGQDIGPSVFPTVIGAGIAICGAMIALGVGRSFEQGDDDTLTHAPDQSPDPAKPRWYGLRALIPVGLLLVYVFAAEKVGFIPIAAAVIFTMAYTMGAKVWQSALLALLAPPVVHLLFSKLLRVPLPIGFLPMPW